MIALIYAAGSSLRIKKSINIEHKSLLKVKKKRLIEHQLNWIQKSDVKKIIVIVKTIHTGFLNSRSSVICLAIAEYVLQILFFHLT